MRKWNLVIFSVVLILAVAGGALRGAPQGRPTVEEATQFIEQAEARLLELWNRAARAAWVQATYITQDTEKISAEAQKDVIAATTDYAMAAARFDGLDLPPDVARKLKLLKLSLTLPAPNNSAAQTELTEIATSLESDYGKGRFCPEDEAGKCYDLNEMTLILAEDRDPEKLKKLWAGWRTISPPMRQRYARLVELANQGARELGFPDTGALWRSNYDMPPDQFAREVDRLWEQVKPLYASLHTYVQRRLQQHYGKQVVPDGPYIPAHLLGNMWSQQWDNIYPLVAPPAAAPVYDLTEILKRKKIDEREMVRYGERFFLSLGFQPLPETFWQRSLFTKPADRDVVCHASAWDVDNDLDLRIKMCIQITAEDFSTVHHELGHNFYQRAYRQLPFLYRNSANDGFHEALGDTISLSVTPEYLKQIGLIETVPGAEGDLGLLMRMALDKIAFLPFGLLVDQWRWKVFSGEITPENYNAGWWELRQRYQGVAPPVARSEADFDPGAKFHVPANVPYTRYFLAFILQFQFHRALCQDAGYTGPLHRCSIYGNKEAGAKLARMMEMGQSRPWPEALEAMTESRQMDATAIIDYFAPLKQWLDEQNRAAQDLD